MSPLVPPLRFAAAVLLTAAPTSIGASAAAQPPADAAAAQAGEAGAGGGAGGAPTFDDKGRQVERPDAPPKPDAITLPKPLGYVAPRYPDEAKRQGLEATVVLKLTIDADGKVVAAEVIEPAGHGFDEAALEAARRQPFSPARHANGNPFKAIIKYRYAFRLEQPKRSPLVAPTTGALLGRILITDLDEPLAGATVTIKSPDGATTQHTTDTGGNFSLPPLLPGRYRLTLQAEGYEPLQVVETVKAGEELTATYRLTAKTTGGVIEVLVEGERPPREVTRRTVEKREIERIPGTNGDALRSIESLPGVARPPGIIGILLVRGSSPFDTQTFVDGIAVPLIYHFGGLSSVVPTELLSKIDFYPGNFSARYGRGMGGIVDAGIRSPKHDAYHGLAQLDLIDARLMLEGPIPWIDSWTFAAAGRRSHLDAWLGPVLEKAGAGVTEAPRYYDYQFIVEKKWSGGGRFRTSFYGSDDGLELLINEPQPGDPALSGNIGLSTVFQRLQFAYEQHYTDSDAVDATLALGHDAISFGLSNLFFDLDVLTLFGRAEYHRKLGPGALLNLGLDMGWGSGAVQARVPAPGRPGQPANQPFSTRNTVTLDQRDFFYRPAGYLEMELTPTARWRIVPGIRLDYAKDTGRLDMSPRLSSRYDVIAGFPRTTVKGGIGLFQQPPQFQQSVPPLGTTGLESNRAVHYGLGVEQEITRQLEVSLEGFYKQMDNLVVSEPSASGTVVTYTNRASGRAVGGELLVKYKPDERFFGWIAYTLSRTVRRNSPAEPEVQVSWDQTHILTILGSYRLGHGWEAGARFRLVSGNLVDPNVCNAADQTCDPTRINALFHGASGAYTPIRFGGDNSERLPIFHQVDLRVDKAWQFSAWKLSAYIDVQNAYNNQNVEGIVYDYRFSTRQYITGIPILPSIGMRGEF